MFTGQSSNRSSLASGGAPSVGAGSVRTVNEELAQDFAPNQASFIRALDRARSSLPLSKKTNKPVGNSGMKLLHAIASTCRHVCGNVPTRIHMMSLTIMDHLARKLPIPEMDTEKVIQDGTSALYKTENENPDKIADLQQIVLPNFVVGVVEGMPGDVYEYGSKDKRGTRSQYTPLEYAASVVGPFWKKRTEEKDRSTTCQTNTSEYKTCLEELWTRNGLVKKAFGDTSTPKRVSDRALGDLLTMYFSNNYHKGFPLKLVVVDKDGDSPMSAISKVRKQRNAKPDGETSENKMHVAVYYYLPEGTGNAMINLMRNVYQKDHREEKANTDLEIKAISSLVKGIDKSSGAMYVNPMTATRLLMTAIPTETVTKGKTTKRVPQLIEEKEFEISLKVSFLSFFVSSLKSRVKTLMSRKEKNPQEAQEANRHRSNALNNFERSLKQNLDGSSATRVSQPAASSSVPRQEDNNNPQQNSKKKAGAASNFETFGRNARNGSSPATQS